MNISEERVKAVKLFLINFLKMSDEKRLDDLAMRLAIITAKDTTRLSPEVLEAAFQQIVEKEFPRVGTQKYIAEAMTPEAQLKYFMGRWTFEGQEKLLIDYTSLVVIGEIPVIKYVSKKEDLTKGNSPVVVMLPELASKPNKGNSKQLRHIERNKFWPLTV